MRRAGVLSKAALAMLLLGLGACNSGGTPVTVPSTQSVASPPVNATVTTTPPTTIPTTETPTPETPTPETPTPETPTPETPTPTATVSIDPFPNANEQVLISHVPADIAPTCIRYTAVRGQPTAAVYCTPSGVAAVRIQYSLYATVGEMNDSYMVANPGGVSGGNCNTDQTAEYAWYFEGESTAGGRVFCFQTSQSTAVMYWTYDALRIVTWDESSNSDNLALYDFWFTAGPDA